ncbi:hypothetical protein BC628DRAFT_613020 [Trametes gibbosa]|nr:hypothetical protein BC628DRAFT_613020 [Trametes gibbosa]
MMECSEVCCKQRPSKGCHRACKFVLQDYQDQRYPPLCCLWRPLRLVHARCLRNFLPGYHYQIGLIFYMLLMWFARRFGPTISRTVVRNTRGGDSALCIWRAWLSTWARPRKTHSPRSGLSLASMGVSTNAGRARGGQCPPGRGLYSSGPPSHETYQDGQPFLPNAGGLPRLPLSPGTVSNIIRVH